MDGKTLARIGAVVFVAIAVTATAIEMTRKGDQQNSPVMQARAVTERDPLGAELVLQPLGDGVGAAVAADVLAHQEDARVVLQRFAQGLAQRLAIAHAAAHGSAPSGV